MLLAFSSCVKEEPLANTDTTGQRTKSADALTAKDHIKIAVLSDIHYMDPELLSNNAQEGTAFKEDLLANPNKALLEYSVPIFRQVLSELLKEHPDIVLVAGDMTKDGEYISHKAVANYFELLSQNNIKVYVLPGNNDINNPDAKAYNDNSSQTVRNATVSDFIDFYSDFGYGSAIAKDAPNSMSYVAQPYPGLWILAIDAAQYIPQGIRPGKIKPETMNWIKSQLQFARENNITVLGLMHHNLIEHLKNQTTTFSNTVVNQSTWTATADSLISWGLPLIFTGHNHSNDITARTFNGRILYDIETGSLITPPSPYRIVTLKNKELEISTNHITSIDVTLPKGMKFTEYSNRALAALFDEYFSSFLIKRPFYYRQSLADSLAPLARNAWMAHIAGDENISPLEQAKIDVFNSPQYVVKPELMLNILSGLWTDLNTKDNKTHIKLTNL